MKNVSKEQLKQWIDRKQDILLVDVLPKEDFRRRSIPGSINVPFKDNKDFISQVEKHARAKDLRIAVYGSNAQSTIAKEAARTLDNAGFSNVYTFEEGVEGWESRSAA